MTDRRSRPTVIFLFGMVAAMTTFFFISSARAGIVTGPEVGTKIPDISAFDQYGKMRTFEELRGPEGLLILFYRTADW